MRVLLDATRLNKGGALQVGAGLLSNLVCAPEYEWHIALSSSFGSQLSAGSLGVLKGVYALKNGSMPWQQALEACCSLPRIERTVKPDVVFTVLGPTLWRPKAPHLIGFAKAMLCYPEQRRRSLEIVPYGEALLASCMDCWSSLRVRPKLKRWFVVETHSIRQRFSERFGIPLERIFVVPNGYNSNFKAKLAEAEAKGGAGKRIILVPSAYYPHKNLDLIPDVARELQARLGDSFEFVLTIDPGIAGSRRVLARAAAAGVAHLIKNYGTVPHAQMPNLYRRSDAVFLPTLLECSTAVYPETFLAEVPLITSDLDFAHELCGEAAMYFDPYSAAGAAVALSEVLLFPAKAAALVSAGKRVLETNFPDPPARWAKLRECLQTVCYAGEHRVV